MVFNLLWCRESQNVPAGAELCKLLAPLLLFLAAFSEALGLQVVSTAHQRQWEMCFFPQFQPWQASNPLLCQEMQEPDLLCRFYSAQGPAVGRCALQLRQLSSCNAQLAEVVFWWFLGQRLHCQSLVEFSWSLQSSCKAGCSRPAVRHMEEQVLMFLRNMKRHVPHIRVIQLCFSAAVSP